MLSLHPFLIFRVSIRTMNRSYIADESNLTSSSVPAATASQLTVNLPSPRRIFSSNKTVKLGFLVNGTEAKSSTSMFINTPLINTDRRHLPESITHPTALKTSTIGPSFIPCILISVSQQTTYHHKTSSGPAAHYPSPSPIVLHTDKECLYATSIHNLKASTAAASSALQLRHHTTASKMSGTYLASNTRSGLSH